MMGREDELSELRGALFRATKAHGVRVPTAEVVLDAIKELGYRKLPKPPIPKIKWDDQALSILKDTYPAGADIALSELSIAGYSFSLCAVRAKAHKMRLVVRKSELFQRLIKEGCINPPPPPPKGKRCAQQS